MFWFVIAGIIAAADLGIKWYIKKYFAYGKTVNLAKDKIQIMCNKNKGAMLGFLKNQARILTGVSILIIGLLIGALFGLTKHKDNKLLKLGLSMLLGGGFGNVWERLTDHEVTDYIRFNIGPKKFRRTVFNLSDFFIFIGSIISFIASLF